MPDVQWDRKEGKENDDKARSKVEEGERRKMIGLYPPQIFPKTGALLRPIVRIAE